MITVSNNTYEAKKVMREIQILRKFSEMKNNYYVAKIYDLIIQEKQNDEKPMVLFLVLELMDHDMKSLLDTSEYM